jgi:hypothetical protein
MRVCVRIPDRLSETCSFAVASKGFLSASQRSAEGDE